jgi:hypothetical protein
MTDQKEVERNCPECDGTGQDRGMHPVRVGEKESVSSLHEVWWVWEDQRGRQLRRPLFPGSEQN